MERVLEVGKAYRMKLGTTYTVIRRFQGNDLRWWVETNRGTNWLESLAADDEEVPDGTPSVLAHPSQGGE